MVFSAADHLRGLGWEGPGKSLTNDPKARSKPIIVAQKKTLGGIGKDRDTSFQWWDSIFESVAKKVESSASGGINGGQRTTKTGIISHLPPVNVPKITTAIPDHKLSIDAFADAQRDFARRKLATSFLRASVIVGTVEESDPVVDEIKIEVDPITSSTPPEGSNNPSDIDPTQKEAKTQKKKRSREEKDRKSSKRTKLDPKEASFEILSPSRSDIVLVDANQVPVEFLKSPSPKLSKSRKDKKDKKSKKEKSERKERRRRKQEEFEDMAPSRNKTKKVVVAPSTGVEYLSPEEALHFEEAAYREALEIARLAKEDEKQFLYPLGLIIISPFQTCRVKE